VADRFETRGQGGSGATAVGPPRCRSSPPKRNGRWPAPNTPNADTEEPPAPASLRGPRPRPGEMSGPPVSSAAVELALASSRFSPSRAAATSGVTGCNPRYSTPPMATRSTHADAPAPLEIPCATDTLEAAGHPMRRRCRSVARPRDDTRRLLAASPPRAAATRLVGQLRVWVRTADSMALASNPPHGRAAQSCFPKPADLQFTRTCCQPARG